MDAAGVSVCGGSGPGAWTCLAALPGEGRLREVPLAEVEGLREQGAVAWVDILGPSSEDTEQLRRHFDFHPLALSDVLNNATRPKQEQYDGTLFTVFGAVNLNPGEDAHDTVNLSLFLQKGLLVTTHCKPLVTTERVQAALREQPAWLARGADYVFYMLLDGVIDRYLDVMEKVQTELDAAERDVFDHWTPACQEVLYGLRRRMASLRRSILPKYDALRVLVYHDFPMVAKDTQIHLRDVLDHVMRIQDALESHREVLTGLMDLNMTQLSNRMNEVMKLLSIIGTVMLPLSFLTGLFGMNFDQMPGVHARLGFWVLLTVMVAVAAGLLYLFRRKGIL